MVWRGHLVYPIYEKLVRRTPFPFAAGFTVTPAHASLAISAPSWTLAPYTVLVRVGEFRIAESPLAPSRSLSRPVTPSGPPRLFISIFCFDSTM